MTQFKSAPGSRQAMFNRRPKFSFATAPKKVSTAKSNKRTLKHAELSQNGLKMTKLARRKNNGSEQEIIQLPTIRLTNSSDGKVVSDAASSVVVAVGVGAAVVWILGIVVLIFVIWGIVRSGQEMVANNTDATANPWYFGIMIAISVLYVIFNIIGSSLAGDMESYIISIQDKDIAQDQESALKAVDSASGSQATYAIGSIFGLGAFCMSIAALARLKLTKSALAKSLAQ